MFAVVVVASAMKYSSVPALFSTPPCLTSRATPTTVNHGAAGLQQGRSRRPSGLSAGQKARDGLIHEDHTSVRVDVRRSEIAPFDERNAHRVGGRRHLLV
jgi:hypothetical protein